MFLLAKDTNDEIKLLRDEFNIYTKEKIKNKTFRKTEGNNESSYKNKLFDKINYKNNSLDKKGHHNIEDIKYLKHRVYLLENQNKNLIQKLKRKEEELSICNNLKNELLYNNSINNYCSNIDNENNEINILKYQNLEKILKNYGNKINNLKNQFNESLIIHQNEIQKIKNIYENNINNKSNIIINNNDINQINDNDFDYDDSINEINNDYFHNYDINEFQITNNINKEKIQNYDESQVNKSFNSDEPIKDEYINSKLAKINTLD